MLAARKLGRPVKWVGSRFETIVSDHHGRAAHLEGELALDRDGRFLALRVHWIVQHGRVPVAARAAHQHAATRPTHAINVYRIPALYGRHRLVLTNTTSDHRLPRRRPAERLLPRRAPGGRGGARDSASTARAAPAQPHSEGGVPVQDADRLDLRQRRSRRASSRRRSSSRTGTAFEVEKKGVDANAESCAASAARCSVEPAGAGARRRRRRRSASASRATRAPRAVPARRGRGTRPCSRKSWRRSSASTRRRITLRRATRTARR